MPSLTERYFKLPDDLRMWVLGWLTDPEHGQTIPIVYGEDGEDGEERSLARVIQSHPIGYTDFLLIAAEWTAKRRTGARKE